MLAGVVGSAISLTARLNCHKCFKTAIGGPPDSILANRVLTAE